ncbi:hypothetical protein GF389_01210 [Candidatus Dojkabacteria bacterium]|nr:hypothetical protein [Candidatus Dojkabacteria bacterium]
MQKLERLKKEIILDQDGKTKAYFHGKNSEKYQGKLVFRVAKPNIDHEVIIKAVLENNSELDLEAVLKVEKGAKNSNTYLKLGCLLLSDDAKARVIPSLEITEDAVKSGHGATVSSINKEHLDYLMSRGISRLDAEKLIVSGFLDF